MSFILDSLKRAEEERRQGGTPPANPLYDERPQPPASRRSPKRLWVPLIVLNLAVVALLAVLLVQRRPSPQTPFPPAEPVSERAALSHPAPPPPTPMPQTKAVPPADAVRGQLPPEPAPQSPSPRVGETYPPPGNEDPSDEGVTFGPPVAARADAIRPAAVGGTPRAPAAASLDPRLPAGEAPATGTPVFETEVLAPPADSAQNLPPEATREPDWVRVPPAPQGQDTSQHAPEVSATAAPAPSRPVPVTRRPTPETPSDETNPSLAAPSYDRVPLLHELPPEVRNKLKQVKINVLVYADRQEASMVYINSRRYRSGDRIGQEGYRLERILPDGIILDYGEGTVKITSGY